MNYDQDKMVPVFGFGAVCKYPNSSIISQVNHCFPCSGDINNCFGYDITGILQHYNYALQNTRLSGPTYFAPIITGALNSVKANWANDPKSYTILLI